MILLLPNGSFEESYLGIDSSGWIVIRTVVM